MCFSFIVFERSLRGSTSAPLALRPSCSPRRDRVRWLRETSEKYARRHDLGFWVACSIIWFLTGGVGICATAKGWLFEISSTNHIFVTGQSFAQFCFTHSYSNFCFMELFISNLVYKRLSKKNEIYHFRVWPKFWIPSCLYFFDSLKNRILIVCVVIWCIQISIRISNI